MNLFNAFYRYTCTSHPALVAECIHFTRNTSFSDTAGLAALPPLEEVTLLWLFARGRLAAVGVDAGARPLFTIDQVLRRAVLS